mgnify:CR=1 FL=1|jgi:nitrate reductase NapE component
MEIIRQYLSDFIYLVFTTEEEEKPLKNWSEILTFYIIMILIFCVLSIAL